MRAHEHEDFAAFVTAAAGETELPEQFVEKDYWITTILGVIAETIPERAIFKGGTSLSKGWDLLDRFSEDIDLFVNPASPPPLSKRGVDRAMGGLCDEVEAIPGLTLVGSRRSRGKSRTDEFAYESAYPLIPGFPPTVRLEPGVRSGDQPTERVSLESIVGAMLTERGVIGELGIDGLQPFEMELLHFRRTFVEKLFAVHGRIAGLADGASIGRDARHYADLYLLAGRPEVLAMLKSDEYESIRLSQDEKSREFFAKSHEPPEGLRFNESEALFPGEELRARIEPVYEEE